MLWLVIARAFAGLGGAGIVPVVWVVMSDIVPQSRRPKWQNFLSLTWSLSAVSGPLLGGLFSGESSLIWISRVSHFNHRKHAS
jgi:MFS family permease